MQYVLNKNHCYLQKMQPEQTKKHKNPVPISDFPLTIKISFPMYVSYAWDTICFDVRNTTALT